VLAAGLVLIVALAFGGDRRLSPAGGVLLALCASGALAGLAGGVRLLDTSMAFRPRLVEDLRIPAVALLAGAGVFAGRGKTVLACLFVPLGVVLADEWLQQVYDWQVGGYHVQVAILIVMVLGAYKAVSTAASSAGRPRAWAWAGLGACTAGMILATASGDPQRPAPACWLALAAGGVLWSAGLGAALWAGRKGPGL